MNSLSKVPLNKAVTIEMPLLVLELHGVLALYTSVSCAAAGRTFRLEPLLWRLLQSLCQAIFQSSHFHWCHTSSPWSSSPTGWQQPFSYTVSALLSSKRINLLQRSHKLRNKDTSSGISSLASSGSSLSSFANNKWSLLAWFANGTSVDKVEMFQMPPARLVFSSPSDGAYGIIAEPLLSDHSLLLS